MWKRASLQPHLPDRCRRSDITRSKDAADKDRRIDKCPAVGRDEDLACVRGPMGSGKNNELLEGCCRLVRGVGTKQEVSGPRDAGVGN